MCTFPQKKENRNVDKMYVSLKKKAFLSILTALPDTYYAIANSIKKYT